MLINTALRRYCLGRFARDGKTVNQLQWLADQGLFDSHPDSENLPHFDRPKGDASLDTRPRLPPRQLCPLPPPRRRSQPQRHFLPRMGGRSLRVRSVQTTSGRRSRSRRKSLRHHPGRPRQQHELDGPRHQDARATQPGGRYIRGRADQRVDRRDAARAVWVISSLLIQIIFELSTGSFYREARAPCASACPCPTPPR